MSDLKHRSPYELRGLVRWCEGKREELAETRRRKLELIEQLKAEADDLGRQIHNIGQKEAWARIWLARKETGQDRSHETISEKPAGKLLRRGIYPPLARPGDSSAS